jgi:hypothetical protein
MAILYLTVHAHILTESAVLVCLCTYLPDDGLVEVETCKSDKGNK